MFTTDAFNYNPRTSMDKLARRLSIFYTNTENLINQLRRVSAKRLITAANLFDKEPPAMYETGDFVPSLDPFDSLETRILTNTPNNLIKNGNINRVPYIIGFMSVEQLEDIEKLEQNPTIIERFTQNQNLLIPQIWNLQPGSSQAQEVIRAILDMYFGGRLNSSNDFLWQWANYASDRHFIFGISKSCRAHSAMQNVFYYRFSYSGAFNFNKRRAGLMSYPGGSHGEDGYYLYRHNVFFGNVSANDIAYSVRLRQVRLWTNFVKSGRPTPNTTNNLISIQWPRTTPNNQEFLDVSQNLVVRNQPYPQRLNMWINFDRRFGG
jgi:carboxylesterase type B